MQKAFIYSTDLHFLFFILLWPMSCESNTDILCTIVLSSWKLYVAIPANCLLTAISKHPTKLKSGPHFLLSL